MSRTALRAPVQLSIGQLARQGGVHLETIRYYERRGLIPRPPRSAAGYRRFPVEALRRVRFIKRAQGLGFSLREIKDLLALRARSDATCANVQARAAAKIAAIEKKLQHLTDMRRALTGLIASCERRDASAACPILDSLGTDD
jgi:Hg(II)-responsive transcriptional regulator